jgi:DNA mismatch repair ATPase MutS
MKARLMFADRDFATEREPRAAEAELIQDLDLNTVWRAMAQRDEVILESVRSALLDGVATVEEVRYRQGVYTDCRSHREVVQEIYTLANEAISEKKKSWRGLGVNANSGEPLLHASLKELEMFVGVLRRLRRLTEEHGDEFSSEGFAKFFATLRAELDDAYFDEVEGHLHNLRFHDGVLASAQLGNGNQGVAYVLRAPSAHRGLLHRPTVQKPSFSHTIPKEDQGGHEALSNLRGRVVTLAANALAQSADHIGSFFGALRRELAFYLGCCNLHEALLARDLPVCVPDPYPSGSLVFDSRGLYDAGLPLRTTAAVQGNDVHADDKPLVVITGANQGGKSTYLRSLGLAHLMMSSGMPVAAEAFSAAITDGVWTHFSREEDASMTSGKFDEELQRMSVIGRHIQPRSLLLCNESFSTTNEREASEIATEIIQAMIDAGIRIVFVTHLFQLSHHFFDHQRDTTLFLRAERGLDGSRPFQLVEAEPLPTSYSEDLYRQTFTTDPTAVGAPASSS